MDIEKSSAALRRARLETNDIPVKETIKILTEMMHEVNISRSENRLLELRIEELEGTNRNGKS